jgi:DNA replication protein DnaC
MADRHGELLAMLRTLKLPAMAAAFPDLALKAAKGGQTHEAFLYDLVQCECVQRDERRIARLLHRSGLPQEKTFATLDLARFPLAIRQQIERLQSGTFVAEAVNVIAVGRPGTGKSHLAAALGHTLVVQGQSVRWTTTAQLVQQLLAAKRDLRLPQALAQLDRFACLILDDIGYVQHDRDEMEVLFTLLAERYERRSVVITTNLVFSEWTRIFKDPMTTLAAIDRVVHHAVILDLMGLESYRVKEANAHQDSRPNAATGHDPVRTSTQETAAVEQANRQV